jgi:UDP-glucose 4-epimerase
VDGAAYAENNPPRPATPYEVTKYSGELLCEGWCNIYGIRLVAPRYFNVYGPGDVPGVWRAVIPNFTRKAIHGEEIVVTGPKASRDFTFIDDAVTLTLAGLKRVTEAPSPIQLIYNVGTGTEVFIKHLAETIKEIYQSTSKITVTELRHWDNAPRRVADCHKVQALFPGEFSGVRRIEEGLRLSQDWYQKVCR